MSDVQLMLFRPEVEESGREPKNIAVIDDYISLVWTDRFSKAGDFELVVPLSEKNVENFKIDYLIMSNFSKHAMFIESISILKNSDGNKNMTIKGRSCESLLERRIVWETTELVNFEMDNKGNITYLKPLDSIIFDEIIKPNMIEEETDAERVIPGFYTLENADSVEDSIFGKYPIESNYKRGTNIYSIITEICEKYSIGFEVIPTIDQSFQNPYISYKMQFLISADRTPYQKEIEGVGKNRVITFATNIENLKDIQKFNSYEKYKNVALVVGELKNDNEKRQKTAIATNGYSEGLSRREMFVDSSDIEEKGIKKAKYIKLLQSRGEDELGKSENQITLTLDGEIIVENAFYKYGVDYNLGDFVMIYDGSLSVNSKVKIEEAVHTSDANGFITTLSLANVSMDASSPDDGILKYLYYYYDVRDLRSAGLKENEEVIVVTGIRFSELLSDKVEQLDIPVKWKEYYILLDISQSV